MNAKITIEERAARLLDGIQSIQGQGGDGDLYRAARALVEGFGFSAEQALPILSAWNARNASPPWSERDLLAKLQYVDRRATRRGYLLEDDYQRGAHRPRSSTALAAPQAIPDEEQARRDREEWPEFRMLKPAGIAAIARLRNLPLMPVEAVARIGLLMGVEFEGHRCFVMCEGGTFAQLRRLDGQPIRGHKTYTLRGSRGSWFGLSRLRTDGPVLIIEGVIGYLEAAAAIFETDRDEWCPLAAVSSAARMTDAVLERLAGREVIVVPDREPSGLRAAGYWLADLERSGCRVRTWLPPSDCADLGKVFGRPDQAVVARSIFSPF